MKKQLLILLILIVVPKSYGQSADSLAPMLEGKWKWIGFYIDDQPQYDTLSTTIEEHFGSGSSSTTYICIWTDTGTYVHQYQKDELIKKELSTKSAISEYVFQDDHSGKVLDYELDPDHSDGDGEDPRFTASVQAFSVENSTIIFKDINSAVKVGIDKITKDELVLRYDDGSTSRFVKYEIRPK